MMTNTNNTLTDEKKLVIGNTFVAALKNNDWDGMHALLSADAVWTLPGTSLLSGPADGAEAIIKRAQDLKKFGVNFDLKHILIGLAGFTLFLHNTSQRDELILDEWVAIVFEVSGEKILKMATYLSDVSGINQFFIPGIIE